jgi:hypothetical protein
LVPFITKIIKESEKFDIQDYFFGFDIFVKYMEGLKDEDKEIINKKLIDQADVKRGILYLVFLK